MSSGTGCMDGLPEIGERAKISTEVKSAQDLSMDALFCIVFLPLNIKNIRVSRTRHEFASSCVYDCYR